MADGDRANASTDALAPGRESASRRGRGLAGTHASPPSGAMTTLRPPRRFQVIGMRTVTNPGDAQQSTLTIREAALRTPSVLLCQEHRKPLPCNGFASAGARLLDARMSDHFNLFSISHWRHGRL